MTAEPAGVETRQRPSPTRPVHMRIETQGPLGQVMIENHDTGEMGWLYGTTITVNDEAFDFRIFTGSIFLTECVDPPAWSWTVIWNGRHLYGTTKSANPHMALFHALVRFRQAVENYLPRMQPEHVNFKRG